MKTTKLLDSETMLKNLIKVDDNRHAIERFYPILTKQAGRVLNATGVIVTLELALYDYTKDLPPLCAVLLRMRMNDFIDAIIDDPEIMTETKVCLSEINKELKGDKK
jgi:hypothetical protein